MRSVNFAEIGARIRERRIELRLTQDNLANAVDVNVSHISNIETNKTKVSLSLLVGICNALNITVDYVLGNEYSFGNELIDREIINVLKELPEDKKKQLLRISKVI